jgi:hypothetical protein
MGVLSMTRIKLRSIRLLPPFLAQQEAAVKQLRSARGFIKGKALIDTSLATWTLVLWDGAEDMRAYYLSGAHRELMPKLRASLPAKQLPQTFLTISQTAFVGVRPPKALLGWTIQLRS